MPSSSVIFLPSTLCCLQATSVSKHSHVDRSAPATSGGGLGQRGVEPRCGYHGTGNGHGQLHRGGHSICKRNVLRSSEWPLCWQNKKMRSVSTLLTVRWQARRQEDRIGGARKVPAGTVLPQSCMDQEATEAAEAGREAEVTSSRDS